MNYIWAFMILIGIVFAVLTGKIPEVTEQILDSSKEAISLLIVMFGVVGMWNGIMKIAEETGLVLSISNKMKPIIHFFHASWNNICKNHGEKKNMKVVLFLSNFIIPLVIFYVIGYGVIERKPVYDYFVRGQRRGLRWC